MIKQFTLLPQMAICLSPLILVIFSLLFASLACTPHTDSLSIMTDHGPVTFQIETAMTPTEKATGLMHRQNMPPDTGMLFIFNPPEQINMWMKNTHISLDMLFIDEQGQIQQIASHTTPFSESIIAGPDTSYAVLEINAGMAEKKGIKAGQQIRHSAFPAR